VLSEVGDDQVLEQLEAHPDTGHGPHTSSSMMAGSVMDSIDHTDPYGERVTVAHGASNSPRAKQTADDAAGRLGAAAARAAGKGAAGEAAEAGSAEGREAGGDAAVGLGQGAAKGSGEGAGKAADKGEDK
jgi:branched-chain amino acid transport system ATP-binding protein